MKVTVLLTFLLLSFNASAVSLKITSSSILADKSVYITSSSIVADKSVYITSSSIVADKSIYINRGYCMGSSVSVYITSSSIVADKSVYITSSSIVADLSVYITSSSILADDEVCVSGSISDEEAVAIYAALNWWIKTKVISNTIGYRRMKIYDVEWKYEENFYNFFIFLIVSILWNIRKHRI